MKFDCPKSVHTWEVLADGSIQLDGESIPTLPWPKAVNDWRLLIQKASAVNGVPEAYIAATMAIESGGKPGLCARLKDGSCSQKEGAGLMAVLPATATQMAGHPVTSQMLLDDHDLSIDVGTKYLKYQLGRYDNSFVHAATAYNAGSVRCGTGKTWRSEEDTRPRLDCDSTWGIVMGCVRGPNDTVILSNYPEKAIKYYNAAVNEGYSPGVATDSHPHGPDGGPLLASAATGAPPTRLLWLGAAGAAAFAIVNWAKRQPWWKKSAT